MLWFMLGIILFLMMLSAFFSGSETAFTAVSTARLRSKAKDGDEAAIRVLKILERKERMIGALLLGNNAVNILASALATVTLPRQWGQKFGFLCRPASTAANVRRISSTGVLYPGCLAKNSCALAAAAPEPQ